MPEGENMPVNAIERPDPPPSITEPCKDDYSIKQEATLRHTTCTGKEKPHGTQGEENPEERLYILEDDDSHPKHLE